MNNLKPSTQFSYSMRLLCTLLDTCILYNNAQLLVNYVTLIEDGAYIISIFIQIQSTCMYGSIYNVHKNFF